jgi:hypothetical protein
MCSPYQPGCGIQKIVDLYHNLNDLVAKAGKHAATNTLDITDIDNIELVGLSDQDIEEELKE